LRAAPQTSQRPCLVVVFHAPLCLASEFLGEPLDRFF